MWILERFAYTPKGVFGRLSLEGMSSSPPLYTVEQPWRNNEPFRSCVPVGRYDIKRYFSPSRRMDVVLLENPALLAAGEARGKARTFIEIHPANWARELQGCIAPGMKLNGSWGVGQSRSAMELVMAVLGDREAVLDIRNASHGGVIE